MRGETIILDTRKKLASYLRGLAADSLRRECKIDELTELLTEAVSLGARMPAGWQRRAKRALKE